MTALLGPRDELLRLVEKSFDDAVIHVRGNEINVDGPDASTVGRVFEELVMLLQQGHPLEPRTVTRTIDMVRADERPSEVLTAEVMRTARGTPVRPKSSGQKRYIDAIVRNVIAFGIGPAGTGKSWLAVAMAVRALQAKTVDRIILTRPAVEAGERLGFLPGDLMAKVDPYLRPLYDALYDMLEPSMQKLLGSAISRTAGVHAWPAAQQRLHHPRRGQNTTPEQMKMFLTASASARAPSCGDRRRSTSAEAQWPRWARGLSAHRWHRVRQPGSRDVVRHRIVQDIVEAYDRRSPDQRTTEGRSR
jgi:phosphate starvation-inducible PhoH-like protein